MTDNNASDPQQGGQNPASDTSREHKKKYEIKVESDSGQQEPVTPPVVEEPGMSLADALQRLEEAEEGVRRHQDDMLRIQADMQNLRRRTEQEVERAHKYGQERLVSELLTVVDNLERALESASLEGVENPATDPAGVQKLQAIRDGVELTLKSFMDCFRKFSIESIDPIGEPFDPQKHQAITMVDSAGAQPNTVTVVMQKGYALNGRVIRPAMVVVSK